MKTKEEDFELPKWMPKNAIVFDWVKYNGEIYFASMNWAESERRQKLILDLAYCATKAHNEIFLKQRVWSKRFQPHKF